MTKLPWQNESPPDDGTLSCFFCYGTENLNQWEPDWGPRLSKKYPEICEAPFAICTRCFEFRENDPELLMPKIMMEYVVNERRRKNTIMSN